MRNAIGTILAISVMFTTQAPAQRRIPKDLSNVRGFNYQSAETIGHVEHWLQYNPAVTERDLDYAKRLGLNQMRVFVPYTAWETDKVAFRKNLVHLVRTAHARGIGVMPTLTYKFEQNREDWPKSRDFVADVIATIGKEPGLAIWDVENEPDCCKLPPSPGNELRMEHAVFMAKMFHELDPRTPVTIGFAFADNMIKFGDAVDVLAYHDYSPTRAKIDANIAKAKQYAASVGKPLINSEIGCIARANPYDVALKEYMDAHVGWYIWELMITKQWGTVHGVLYPDGTVRDPSTAAALLGFFRNRGTDVIEEVPDRENQVTSIVANNQKWLSDPNADWNAGIDLAETSANLLEAAQLVPMHDLPTRRVILLRAGQPDLPALRSLLTGFTSALEPYRLSLDDSRHSRPAGYIN